MRSATWLLLVPAGLFGAAVFAAPVTLTINPAKDAFVNANNPTKPDAADRNFGGAGQLAVSADAGYPKGTFKSVMGFNLLAIRNTFDSAFGAGNWQPRNLSLTLTTNANAPGPASPLNSNVAGNADIFQMADDSWIEGTGTGVGVLGSNGVTWNSLPGYLAAGTTSLGTIDFAPSMATTTMLPLVPGAVSAVKNGQAFDLYFTAADPAISYAFFSRAGSGGDSNPPPVLIIGAAMYGDANEDGDVNALDFNVLASNLGLPNRDWSEGDFNGDGLVNTVDLDLLVGNFGKSVNPVIPGIPEPTAISLFAVASLFAVRRKR